MKKLILLAILAGLAWWYFDGSRRMTETQIREDYARQAEALERFDGDALCAHMADHYHSVAFANGPDGPLRLERNREQACSEVRRSMRRFQRIATLSRGLLAPDVELEVEDIDLAPNRKSATVHTRTVLRVAGMTLAREREEEHLIRRTGRS